MSYILYFCFLNFSGISSTEVIPGAVVNDDKHMRIIRGVLNLNIDLSANPDLANYLCDIDDLVLKVSASFSTFKHIDSSINELSVYLKNVTINFNSKLIQDHLHGILNSLHIILNQVHICDTIFSLANVNVLHHSIITQDTLFAVVKEGSFMLKLDPPFLLSITYFRDCLYLCHVSSSDLPYIDKLSIPLSDETLFSTLVIHPFPSIKNNNFNNKFFELDMPHSFL